MIYFFSINYKSIIIYSVITLSLSLALPNNTEFRSTWVITWDHINRYENADQNMDRVIKIMDDHVDANMNAVIFQVRQGGTAYYHSSYEPWGYYAGYQYPGYDPLAFAIEEAHNRGLELHAWFNVFQTSSTHNGAPSTEHPEWICRDQNGIPMTSYRSLSPGLEEVREYTINVAMEIVQNYDIDGLHLDYVRWNEHTNSQRGSPTFQEELKRLDGSITENQFHDLSLNPSGRFLYDYEHPYSAGIPNGFNSWEEWWRWSVTTFVKTLHDSIQSVKPHVKLSAAVLGKYNWSGWQGYGTVYQDAALWYNEGYLDHIMPMSYHWTTSDGFRDMLSDDCPNCWELFIQPGIESGRPFTVGPGSYVLDEYNVWNNHSSIVSVIRELSWVGGFQFFSYATWRDQEYFLTAGETFFSEKAKINTNPLNKPSLLKPPVIVLSPLDEHFQLDIFPKESEEPNWIITYKSNIPTSSSQNAQIIDIHYTMEQFIIPLNFSLTDTSTTQFFFSTSADRFWQESEKSNLVFYNHDGKHPLKSFRLSQNYPNPFYDETMFLITTSYKRNIELTIWSVQGKKIRTLFKDELHPGYHVYKWNGKNNLGKNVASGIYFCSLIWKENIMDTKKLIYIN
ncbi:MAG: hypothetical protein CMG57_06970 [Candidatus Marinimicrobia bacterium]|nr:hypothetical protein [Candidatus Neomarinimicrobiota bacterium]